MTPPSAAGDDRVALRPDGTILLSSRHDKGWVPRKEKDLVHAAFPGTCVQWGEEQFEVVRAEPLGSGVRYSLLPWDGANAIRTIEAYDETSERQRAERRAENARRAAKRQVSLWLALVVGDLPAAMQEEMESELGIRASRLTLASVAPLLVWGVFSLVYTIASIGGAAIPPFPEALLAPGLYFFAESLVRLGWAMSTGRPIGSFPVVLVAEALRHVAGRKQPAARRLPPPEIDPAVELMDAYRLREPYLAFLPPERQIELTSRYGFDAILWGKRTAWLILVFSLLGVVTGIRGGGPTGWLAAASGAFLAVEQVARLRRLLRGLPAGSIVGRLVEPMARRLG